MKFLCLRKKCLLTILLLPILMFSLNGCIYMVVGGIGVVSGYIVSPDTVEGISGNDELVVWDAVIEIVSIMGLILEEQAEGGVIIAKINGANVTITITPLNQTTVKLTIKARKAYLPRIAIAQDVFTKVLNRLGE